MVDNEQGYIPQNEPWYNKWHVDKMMALAAIMATLNHTIPVILDTLDIKDPSIHEAAKTVNNVVSAYAISMITVGSMHELVDNHLTSTKSSNLSPFNFHRTQTH